MPRSFKSTLMKIIFSRRESASKTNALRYIPSLNSQQEALEKGAQFDALMKETLKFQEEVSRLHKENAMLRNQLIQNSNLMSMNNPHRYGGAGGFFVQ